MNVAPKSLDLGRERLEMGGGDEALARPASIVLPRPCTPAVSTADSSTTQVLTPRPRLWIDGLQDKDVLYLFYESFLHVERAHRRRHIKTKAAQ